MKVLKVNAKQIEILRQINKNTLNIMEITQIAGCSRNFVYQKMRDGTFEYIKTGKKKGRRVKRDSIYQYLLKYL